MKKTRLHSLLHCWPLALALLLMTLTALADVTLPANLTVIEAEAYMNDASLTGTLHLPHGVQAIGARAFEGCTGLTGELVIPDGVRIIGSRAFAYCTGLTGAVRIPESVTSLADDAFLGTNLTIVLDSDDPDDDVTTDTDLPGSGGTSTDTDLPGSGGTSTDTDLPGSGGTSTDTDLPGSGGEPDDEPVITMTDLPEGISYEMTTDGAVITGYYGAADAELTIPATISGIPVVAIGDNAFQSCYGLTGSVVIPDTVTRIGASAFFGCSSLDGTVVIPDSVTSIGDFAFYECLSLTGGLTLPDSVETVGESAFAFCESMTGSLTLPANVTLGMRCFQSSGFTGSLTIPSTMSLGANVFTGTALDITWEAPAFTYRQTSSIITITGWNGPVDNGLSIPSEINQGLVCGIAAEAFADIGLTGAVTLPVSLIYVGDSAFRSNPGITSVSFAPGLTTIAAYAFADCTGLTGTITLPSTVTSLDETAFEGVDVTIEIAPATN